MSSDKPINAMYGGKVKLDLDKLKNNRKSDEEKSKPVVEVEETITKEPVQEVPNEEVVIESAKEDVIENEVVEEPLSFYERVELLEARVTELENIINNLK